MAVTMSLNLDGAPLSEATPIDVPLSIQQKNKLKFGVPEVTTDPYVINLNGAGLRVDINQNPKYRKFCGTLLDDLGCILQNRAPSFTLLDSCHIHFWISGDLTRAHTGSLFMTFCFSYSNTGLPLVSREAIMWVTSCYQLFFDQIKTLN